MFADLLQWLLRRPTPAYDDAFITDVQVRRPVPRDPKVERLILVCWILIAVKHGLVIWAVHHWRVPFHQLWVNAPTWILGVVATFAYYQRD
ncbi:MAG TPA: hypothetical protein VEB66_07600 [Opitutaceae bacterium]|nr:hypothetical protein [Opitutaceae bacterium]